MGPDTMIFVFWMLSFKPYFSFPSLTFIKRLFSSLSLSAIRAVSSADLSLSIFLPAIAILIPACAPFSLAFHMMYSAYELNKQGDNIQSWCTPFPVLNQSFVPCEVVPVASWPAYKFLKRGNIVWYSYLFKNCPQKKKKKNCPQFDVVHTVKGLWVANETKVEVFWNPLAFSMIQGILAIWCMVPLPFLNLACKSGSYLFKYCWSLAWRSLSITLLAWEVNAIVW